MKSRLKFTIFALFLLIPSLSLAQIPTSIDGVRISIDPELPAPGQTVTVRVESFSTELSAASIVWLIDGKNFAQGIGKTTIGISAPAVGKSTLVLAVIRTVEGREVKKSITVKSGGADLVWESSGYTPPFYKGKALFAYENTLKITAIPHLASSNGIEIDPKTLVYKWMKNTKVVQDQSGYGKQTLIVQEDIPQPLDIQVDVTTSTGSEKATSYITLNPGDPSVSFYREDPLYGVFYNKALTGNVRLTNSELNLRAVPYTFNLAGLSYLWIVNNLERPDLSTKESITLRTKGDVEGKSAISLQVRNDNNILQGAQNSVSVLFSKKPPETGTIF